MIREISKEAKSVQDRCQSSSDACLIHLVEVFCHENSELTKQVQNLNGKAVRMGLSQGDLSTPDGRKTLFEIMFMNRPRNVWYSPTCSPWCAWYRFNEQRSIELFEHVQHERDSRLYELALGIVLLRITRSQGTHFHWEQARQSLMFKTPMLHELFEVTREAHFDMRNAGDLKCPGQVCTLRRAWQFERHQSTCVTPSTGARVIETMSTGPLLDRSKPTKGGSHAVRSPKNILGSLLEEWRS